MMTSFGGVIAAAGIFFTVYSYVIEIPKPPAMLG